MQVHGIVRRSSSFNTGRIEHLYKNPQAHIEGNMKLHYGDLTDSTCLVKIINEVKPTEIYNLGAQSHVKEQLFLSYPLNAVLDLDLSPGLEKASGPPGETQMRRRDYGAVGVGWGRHGLPPGFAVPQHLQDTQVE
ncbi:hypothetical protein CB1_000218011 [Camelus ferus]|nr:hypothetical protein CB1_000218011 [Camelus ferus]